MNFRMLSLFFFIVLLMCIGNGQDVQFPIYEEPIDEVVTDAYAVLSRNAILPCNITPSVDNDKVNMVYWYKNGNNKPIFTFDVRNRPLNQANQWSDGNLFGSRAYFVTLSNPASLSIDNVQLDDEGIYHYKIDFMKSPAREGAVNLTVIIPFQDVFIYDKSGHEISNVIGPIREGSDLVLICEVPGGKPTPKLSWYHNKRLVRGITDHIDQVTVNRIQINNLSRNELNSTFECQAINSKLTLPIVKTAYLDMWFFPTNASISPKLQEFVAGEQVLIYCEVTGSKPTADISWMQDNKSFKKAEVFESYPNDTVTLGSVYFAPEPEDDGTVLKCIGKNPKIPDVSKEDSFKLNVVYSPLVIITFGTSLNPDNIKEGDDVYFECTIRANPKEHKILWYHNGALINQNISAGIIVTTSSLILQRITRYQGGLYSCLAANSRGETMSEPINLPVKYAPICLKRSEISIIGAGLNENINVFCQVEADPSDLTFLWQFNNGGENFDIHPPRFTTSSGNLNELEYTVKSQRDFGTLTCWASNLIGRQIEPCIFQIIPASQPSPVSNCTLRIINNQTNDVVDIECKAGYDGGLPQIFILEAFDARSMQLRINQSVTDMENPLFHLNFDDVAQFSRGLKVIIYAENAKGKSDRFLLNDILINNVKQHNDEDNNMNLPVATLLAAALLTSVIVIIVILTTNAQKRHAKTSNELKPNLNLASSVMKINAEENHYVVSYTVKPITTYSLDSVNTRSESIKKQPDILKISPDETGLPSEFNDSSSNYYDKIAKDYSTMFNFQFNSLERTPTDRFYGNGIPSSIKREHIISDTIPGPESCV